jgi:hypothetical protein
LPQQIFNFVYLLLCGASGPPAVLATVVWQLMVKRSWLSNFLSVFGGPDGALHVDDVSFVSGVLQFLMPFFSILLFVWRFVS